MEPALPRCSLAGPPDGAALIGALEDVRGSLPDWLRARRWFRSKGRAIRGVTISDAGVLPVGPPEAGPAALVLLDVGFADGGAETYLLALAARPAAAARAALPSDVAGLARLGAPEGDWLLYDGLDDPAVSRALLRCVEDARDLPARLGRFSFDRTPALSRATGGAHPVAVTSLRRLRGEQSNTSIVYDDRLVLKVFRRLDAGESPELEVGRFLTLRARFPHVPQLAGFAGYAGPAGNPTVAVLTTFVPNDGDAWSWALARLRDYYAAVRTRPSAEATPAGAAALVADDLATARRLGEVTGELHVALASDPDDPAFAPEPVTPGDLEAWGTAVEARVAGALAELRRARVAAPGPGIERVLATAGGAAARIRDAIGRLVGVPLWKTRGHGDYHLGQVLRVAGPGDRFAILDFEGEPARPLAERRARHSPLRDVAGMLRSFTYASWAGLFEAAGPPSAARRDDQPWEPWEPWRAAWDAAAGSAFLQGYLAATVERGVKLVPASPDVRGLLLSVFSLEKAAYEVSYEINNRPAWLPIPLAAFERELAA